ncbi:hypothetical protein CDAR_69751 [Caerostris darwini]|uniref:Uncharacterized protein n=1 Tax=Caerostris darwini TaxID=1538125 RepID=A0AAV4U0U6_9ARAC|nr:hypothetical protein CDAR_69751 [Caerostris darwini]
MAAPRRLLVHSNHVTISSETEYRRWVLFPNLDLCLYAAVQGQANVRSHCVSTFPNALSSELFSTNSLASLDRRVTSGYMEAFVQITVQHQNYLSIECLTFWDYKYFKLFYVCVRMK